MKNLSAKLLEVQKDLKAIPKDSTNPFFKSKYYDINTLLGTLRPILNKHGIVVLQPVAATGLKTIIMHGESGEMIEEIMPLPQTADVQKLGAAITYCRRYALASAFCLESEDDDGNSVASKPAKSLDQAFDEVNELTYEPPPFQDDTQATPPTALGLCSKCSAPNKLSKAGKVYCGDLCWKK